MQPVNKLIDLNPPSSECAKQTANQAALLTSRHISRLWERMAGTFGHRWTSQFSEKDDGTWLAGLQDLTPQQIADGLERVIQSGKDWPPTLPEFRAMCADKPVNGFGLDYTPAYYRNQATTDALRLETDRAGYMTASAETVNDGLASMRDALKGKR